MSQLNCQFPNCYLWIHTNFILQGHLPPLLKKIAMVYSVFHSKSIIFHSSAPIYLNT